LKYLPADGIKIDRAFVRDMVTRKRDHGVVTSMVNMAHDLGVRVVAEGVESRGELEALRALACDCFKGYYFSEAVDLGRLLRLLVSPQADDWLAERRRVAN
jgi:EAL domain-containing protein (putative c-di-GMP-specific phosphodiesterase class I)